MPEVLSAFDVFVLSSHDEGMSNAILEAMAMQKPVVATDVGGTGEVVQHGRSGLLVPPQGPGAAGGGDRRRCSATRRGRGDGTARAARSWSSGFSAHAMVRQMEDLYTHLLRERGAGAPARRRCEAAQ